jgi:hypothetical protein
MGIAADIDPRPLVIIRPGDEMLTTVTARPRFIASLDGVRRYRTQAWNRSRWIRSC